MKIALLGYGKMGQMVRQAAERESIQVAAIIDPNLGMSGELSGVDVCIDFTEPGGIIGNIKSAAAARVSMVVGTTGWYAHVDEVRSLVQDAGIGFVYGSNFSIGVNLMFKVAAYAAQVFSRFPAYDPYIEEAHHKFKKDAPSGTAIFLQKITERVYGRDIPTSSTRAGYMPGRHTVGFDSEADTLTIEHTARDRSGFAAGAILAARWIAERKGFYEFSQIIEHELENFEF